MSLGDLPLHAKLDAECTGRELAERVRKDPERNKHSDEEDADAEKLGQADFCMCWCVGHPHDRKTTADVLTRGASDGAPPVSGWINRQRVLQILKEHQEKTTYAMAPQFPIIVATVESNLESPLVSCR